MQSACVWVEISMRASLEKVEHRSSFLYIQIHFVQRIQFIKFIAKCYYHFKSGIL